jgi:type IV pilus assembly protein PilW
MSARRSQKGFTLIELMVSLGVVVFCISLVLGVFISQQKAFASLDLVRVAAEAGRDASMDFETSLRRAGWGMDPRYAFDFKYLTKDATGASISCGATSCRDKTDGPDSIVFYARNPNYHWDPNGTGGPPACAVAAGCFIGKAWLVTSASTSSVTLTTRVGDVIEKGQIILLTLDNGSPPAPAGSPTPAGSAPVMVTAAARVSATSTSTTVSLSNVANDIYQQNAANSYPVTTGGTSPPLYAFLIDRFAYSIVTYNNIPYLMLDTGLTKQVNGSPVPEMVPVAANVEDLQISYVINTPIGGGTGPDNNGNWIVGDTSGVQEEPSPTAAGPNPDYIGAPVNDPGRFTLNPANVRMVRFQMVVRSYRPDPGPDPSWAGDPFPILENRGAASAPASLGRFRRVVVSGSVATRNMESRNPFVF